MIVKTAIYFYYTSLGYLKIILLGRFIIYKNKFCLSIFPL